MQEQKSKFISLLRDITFKTLWINGSPSTKKYLNRIISNIVRYDTSEFKLTTNELSINNYKSIANCVDILLHNNDNTKLNSIENIQYV